MKKEFRNKKLGIYQNGSSLPRCYWRKCGRKKAPSVLIKCGDCDEKVEIYYDKYGIEINGINASVEWWKGFFDYIFNKSQ
ncbi:hypothetical protein COY52_03530 [Candidatus Desantisbacteria bacterium CG_4_10_14_0_8_um_filter_48_22]|uniref:Uncharacterized protein n=1 Tax=Candidatus Desantisbacteria bacterium CG_4_10_14_0_8_um_filter_48_22 TaxID=1974543 RepID=A0A2M7SDQ8_9BACT|nr:MAG: hypothetical protein AUJ67_08510 [Candidatus Desantisbacteria bacterium CG1_02_49_89]PIV56198.1 MAG: hypothetical protein COS16_04825 [Candidatus Desantisbacteria bacterium CG02_land_8_20_14_3_00_49_13]PIZ17652.1 MAG: hypothetical protein COY52_03530 [Candidatus Desantisbacteria bacterium CG_4_10_14_0_8_um_filter_48_22]PJB27754.1 MAG: hypothetical protein CO111_03655 [Candidatus Desantisbacteria bacterium CG_4_9_14_3_um_filter_50_7]